MRHGAHSERLRDSVASLARQLSNSLVDWHNIQALMANRLVALDKRPGVRPIGIGECLRRIVGKCLAIATGMDVTEICGSDQLCTGLNAGIEGAIHAMDDIYKKESVNSWGVLLMDAANAFNCINRKTAFWTARSKWPRCARFLFNTYRGQSPLVLQGTDQLLYSKEGVTQDDPLSRQLYATVVLPLITSLKETNKNVIQNWYADDASAVGGLDNLCKWFDNLLNKGPEFGYYPEPQKSYLIVAREYVSQAREVFKEYGVKIVTGQRFLGGYLGDEQGLGDYMQGKVADWCRCIEALTTAADTQPQAAFTAFTKSLQCEWAYCQRVIPNCSESLERIEKVITEKFLPVIMGGSITTSERILFSLPARKGGLGIPNPSTTAAATFNLSKAAISVLSDSIKGVSSFSCSVFPPLWPA